MKCNFIQKKRQAERIIILTAYDTFTARLIEKAELDAILVGDSLAMVALGYENTLPVKMDEMIHHSKAVRRGAPNTFLIGDLPFEVCHDSPEQMVDAAERFLDEGGCNAVKVEGAEGVRLEAIQIMRKKKIEVMGHVGLLPQLHAQEGKPLKVQGVDASSALRIQKAAHLLDSLGIFSLVLECIPTGLAKRITQEINCPTIGIGAGPECDGQVLVTDDLLGRYDRIHPKFAKQYLDSSGLTLQAFEKFKKDVKEKQFPAKEQSFGG